MSETNESTEDRNAPEARAAKASLRSWARAERAGLMRHGAAEKSAVVTAAVRATAAYQAAGTVACYRAFGSELDLSALASDATGNQGKRFVWPRTHEAPRAHLTLHAVADVNEPNAWERHRFGQLEPKSDSPPVDPRDVDLVLVPGLAFDGRGHRLGYGKGYYDALLPLLRPDAVVVGVALDALVVPDVPHDERDFPVRYLVTESGWRATVTEEAVASAATSGQLG